MKSPPGLFCLLCLTGIMLSLGGCISTIDSYEKPYTESISSILVTDDNKHIVVIGREYHYIFDAPPKLLKILNAPLHKAVSADISSFIADPAGKISGSYTLFVVPEATSEEKAEAIAAGFHDYKFSIEYSGRLTGSRYASGGITAQLTSQLLNRTYEVSVRVRKSDTRIAFENMMSPVHKIIDSEMLAMGPKPLLPLWFKIYCNECKDCKYCDKKTATH